jgi:hypothetical protein
MALFRFGRSRITPSSTPRSTGRSPGSPSTRLRLECLESRDVPAGTPLNLVATPVSTSEVNLTWELADATDTAIVIERRTGAGTYQVLTTLPGGEHVFTDSSCWANTTYTYRVRARDASGDSPPSPERAATTFQMPAGTLTTPGLTVTAASPTVARITVQGPAGTGGYFVERSDNGVAYRVVVIMRVGDFWEDETLTPGATYWYRVRASSWDGESGYSAPVTLTLPGRPASTPVEPSGLRADAPSSTTVVLTWVNNDSSNPRFVIERAAYNPWGAQAWAVIATTNPGVTSFTDTGRAPETPYVYRVKATNTAGSSGYAVPADEVMRSIFGAGVAVTTPSAGTGTPKTYDIGPGKTYANIRDLDWSKLGPGDTVNIHFKPGGYRELLQISTRGTANAWITINGVPDPATGALPIIDGANAVLAPQFNSFYPPINGWGVILVGPRPGYVGGYKPGYIRIQNLQLQHAYSTYQFTDVDGSVKAYEGHAAGVYLTRADHVTIKGCVLTDNGQGVFGAGQSGYDRLMSDITLDSNHIFGNGHVNSYLEHNTYLEGINTVYQYNRYGPTRAGSEGAGLKDRSAGLVIRYNYVEGGAVLLQLPESQNQFELAVTLPSYRQSFVYGNVLVDPPGWNSNFVWFGGDQGLDAYNRKGVLYFYHNTLVARSDWSQVDAVTLFRMQTRAEVLDARNNIFTAIPNTATAQAPEIGLINEDSIGYFGRNLVTGVFRQTSKWRGFEGVMVGGENLLSAANSGFTGWLGGDYRLATTSRAVDVGGRLAGSVAAYPVDSQYAGTRLGGLARPVVGPAADLGAYEAWTYTYPPPPPPPPPPTGAGEFWFPKMSYAAFEGTQVVVSVARVGGTTGAVSVRYATENGTATAGSDYVATSGTLSWAAGEFGTKTFTVTILSDSLTEAPEVFRVRLSSPTGGAELMDVETATITIDDPQVTPPVVASVVINGGAAQRSRVTQVAVTFDTVVDPALLATAFALARAGGGSVGVVSVSSSVAGGRTTAVLTFSGANTEFGSLADGRWTLTIDRTRVRATATGLFMAANSTHGGINRLFGDADGSGAVDVADYNAFRAALGRSAGGPGYDPALDWDADGVVDVADRNAFRARLGTALP